MSGALRPGVAEVTRPGPLTGRKKLLLSKVKRNAEPNKAIEALKARMDAALAAEREEHIQIPSSIPVEPQATAKPPIQGHQIMKSIEIPERRHSTERSVQATPRVAASILRASNFKRRPRQPSLLRLVQAEATQQSEDEDDEDLDDFHPDDESTPFLKSRSHPSLHRSPTPPPPSVPLDQTSSSRKRKLSSPEIQVPMSQHTEGAVAFSPARSSPTPELEPEENIYDLPSCQPNTNFRPSLPLPPLPHQSTKTAAQPLSPHSDTLAPPQGSSSPAPPRPQRVKPNSTRKKHSSASIDPPRSPSVLPTPHHLTASTTTGALKPLTTASLQNLLPRRRLRPNPNQGQSDVFDVPSSSDAELDIAALAEDEDELTVHTKVKVRAKARNHRTLDPAWETDPKNPKTKRQRGKPQQPRGKEKASGTGKPKRTYTRKSVVVVDASNDENEGDGDDLHNDGGDGDGNARSGATAPRGDAKAELQRLARKFREVDEWQLEIEDVTASSGGMRDAR